jgi:hypothetical protein
MRDPTGAGRSLGEGRRQPEFLEDPTRKKPRTRQFRTHSRGDETLAASETRRFAQRILAALAPTLGCLFLAACWSEIGARDPLAPVWGQMDTRAFSVVYPEGSRADAKETSRVVSACAKRIAAYFGFPYPRRFTVRLFEDRASLTAYWRSAWSEPSLQPQCWMVASGTASALALLSPTAWAKEACDHDPADSHATERLIAHELVHVYHGQVNPNPEFDGLEEMGWFVEGLAVSVSGQLDADRLERARRAVAQGKGPMRLTEAWSGPDRYGIAGSLVAWLEETRGRNTLLRMMRCGSNAEILAVAGCGEEELLDSWRRWLLNAPAVTHKAAPSASRAGAPVPPNLQ